MEKRNPLFQEMRDLMERKKRQMTKRMKKEGQVHSTSFSDNLLYYRGRARPWGHRGEQDPEESNRSPWESNRVTAVVVSDKPRMKI